MLQFDLLKIKKDKTFFLRFYPFLGIRKVFNLVLIFTEPHLS